MQYFTFLSSDKITAPKLMEFRLLTEKSDVRVIQSS